MLMGYVYNDWTTMEACLRDQTWLCVYCWCQTPEGVVRPCRAITRAQPEWSLRGETTPESPSHRITRVASTPGHENARASFFAGDWACEIELRQIGVICYPWQQRRWSCGVFTSWISDAHCPFQWKWQVLHNYDIFVLQQVGIYFDWIACLMKVWPLFKREFPRVPMTWRSACARANFKCDVADINK